MKSSGYVSGIGSAWISGRNDDTAFPSISGGQSLTMAGSESYTVSADLKGLGGFVLDKSINSAAITLTGANSYTGGTKVNAGTLQLGDGSIQPAAASSSYQIASGATLILRFNTANGYTNLANTIANSVTGAGNLVFMTGKTFDTTLTTIMPTGFTGAISVLGGRLPASNARLGNVSSINIGNGGQLWFESAGGAQTKTYPISMAGAGYGELGYEFAIRFGNNTNLSGAITLTADTALGAENGRTVNISNVISGLFGLSFGRVGGIAGIFVLSANNTYTGTTTITSGTLQVGNNGTEGSIGTGNIVNNSNLIYLYNVNRRLDLPNTNYSGSGSLSATSGNVNFTGNLSVGGSFTSNSTNGNYISVLTPVDSTITASSINLQGWLHAGSLNANILAFNTSASNGPINLTGIYSGNPGIAFSYNNLVFNAGTGTITLTGNNEFAWWTAGATLTFAGNLTGAGNIVLRGGQSNGNILITANQAGNSTYAGAITIASANFTKAGTGTLTLTGVNTYTGATTISAGNLELSSNGRIGASPTLSIAFGATLTLAHTTIDYNYAGNIIGTGTINKTGTNTETILSGNNSGFSGNINVSNGRLRLNGANAGSASARFFVSAGSLTANTADTFNLGELSGTGGSLQVGGGAAATVLIGALNTNTTFAGVIQNALSLIKVGTGTLTLTGANSYTGGTTISGGTIDAVNNASALGSVSSGVILGDANSGTSAIRLVIGRYNRTGGLTVSANGVGVKTLAIGGGSHGLTGSTLGTISVLSPLTIDRSASSLSFFTGTIIGSGNITLIGGSSYTIFSLNDSLYTGVVTVNSGARVDFRSRFKSIINNGTIDIVQVTNFTSLTGSGTVTTNSGFGSGTRSLTITNTVNIAYDGIIIEASGAPLAFTKAGSGVLNLNGVNTYTGVTSISSGLLGGTGSGALSSHTVESGASIFGGSGGVGTYTCGALTFSSLGSKLAVYSDGVTVSRVNSGTITAASGFTVDFNSPMPVGTFTLIGNTGTLPTVLPSIGIDLSGKIRQLFWTAGVGLTVTFTAVASRLADQNGSRIADESGNNIASA